ncbi:hypothetical protein E4U42_007462 [Claviceps africana]|uniref:F-box domain-containing protein n=1 Tax=Claviceps africana TaxID=83212 RepID=A0A8K0NII7_9HYPO|nr:hypothetical protein E4U42_007462 [Claviceps africana]
MDRLPVEVMQLILSHFCRHCTGQGTPGEYVPWFSWSANLPPFGRHPLCGHGHGGGRDTAPLHALSLTSRALRAVAQPILYHELNLDLDEELPDDGASPTLFLFARSVVHNRHLAGWTRRITATRPVRAWFPPYRPARDVVAEVLPDLTVDYCPGSGSGPGQQEHRDDGSSGEAVAIHHQAFCRALNLGAASALPPRSSFASEALLAVVVSLLPNLSSLSLAQRSWCLPNIYHSVVNPMRASLPQLRHLSCTVTFQRLPDLVHAAPDLVELHLHDLQGHRGPVPRLPKLRVLRIMLHTDPVRPPAFVEAVVDACEGRLRDFTYYQHHASREVEAMRSTSHVLLGNHSDANDIWTAPEWDVPDLERCLARHKQSLTRLELDVQQRRVRAGLPTLEDYDSVDTLTISPWYAHPWCRAAATSTNARPGLESLLPRNLRVLRVRLNWTSSLCRHLLEMLLALAETLHKTGKSRLSSLRVVECAVLVDVDWIKRLQEAFSRVAIQFKTADDLHSFRGPDGVNRLLFELKLYNEYRRERRRANT